MPWGSNIFQLIVGLIGLVCGIICCWLVVESISLWFEDIGIPKWILWMPIFCMWSLIIYCFYLFLNSFNPYIYVEFRRGKFIVGLFGLFLLWFGLFLPTNAHTFFYKQMAKGTAVIELKHVDGELQKLSDENAFLETYNAEWDKYESDVMGALAAIKAEIKDSQNTRTGDKTEARVVETEDLLGIKTGTIARLKARDRSRKEINKACEHYDTAVKEQLAVKKQQHEANVARVYSDFQERMKNVAPFRRDIKATLDQLNDDMYTKEDVLKNARKVIGRTYAELESQFNGIYTYDENVYRSDRLVKVTKVWGDYFKGQFKNTDYSLW